MEAELSTLTRRIMELEEELEHVRETANSYEIELQNLRTMR